MTTSYYTLRPPPRTSVGSKLHYCSPGLALRARYVALKARLLELDAPLRSSGTSQHLVPPSLVRSHDHAVEML